MTDAHRTGEAGVLGGWLRREWPHRTITYIVMVVTVGAALLWSTGLLTAGERGMLASSAIQPSTSVCTQNDVQATAQPARARYSKGELVSIKLELVNTSQHPCPRPDSLSLVILDSTDEPVGGSAVYVACPPGGCGDFGPGETFSFSLPWNQEVASRSRGSLPVAPAGRYRAIASLQDGRGGPRYVTPERAFDVDG